MFDKIEYIFKNDYIRAFLFLFFCLGSRSLLAYLAYKYYNNIIIKYFLVIFTLIVSLVWGYLYLFDTRKYAFEANGKVWWNKLRVIHSIIYLVFAFLMINKITWAWKLLALDVIIAFFSWILYRGFNFEF